MSGIENIQNAVASAKKGQKSPDRDPAVPRRKNTGLPSNCPVVPLGKDVDVFYYLDACRQLRIMKAKDHSRLPVQSLFAPHIGYCEAEWPRYTKDGDVAGADWNAVAEALMSACATIGAVDIEKRVRGPGAWLGEDGELVLHCGDKIYSSDQAYLPGRIGDHFYPGAPAIPHPADNDADAQKAAQELLDLLKTWNWRRPDLDPYLMMGWIGAALMGGAIDWRPLVWISGDKATGKSTLQKVVQMVIGETALVSSVDATAAGIRQAVGHMSLPVALDELEADEDNRKANDVVKIARYACSAGQSLRGGADHKGASFQLRNCFLFSSILIPPLLSQDVSRMAILQLDRLNDVMPPALEPKRLKQFGKLFRRRLMRLWPQFCEVLETWRAQLTMEGHEGRSADQFGTLMACYDILLHDHPPHSDTLAQWSGRLKYSGLSEAEDSVADWERCVAHLMTCPLDYFRKGEKRSVGSWVIQAAGRGAHGMDDPVEANKALSNYGMRVIDYDVYGDGKTLVKMLLVANSHQGLASLFHETRWKGASGSSGVWVQSFRRVPGASAAKKPTTFDGVMTRYTMIPLDQIIHDDLKAGGVSCHL